MGENDKAEKSLQKALKQAPDNAAANFNMGLLKAEKNDLKAAEKYLRKAFKADPQMAQAAYNLCIITRQGPHRRGGGLVPEGGGTQAAGPEVCLHARLLSEPGRARRPRRSGS